jgi:hypothetical protein
MKGQQRRAADPVGERRQGRARSDAVALRADADAVQQDVRLVRRRGGLGLAQHHLEAVVDAQARPTSVAAMHADRRDREEPVAADIEPARLDVEHDQRASSTAGSARTSGGRPATSHDLSGGSRARCAAAAGAPPCTPRAACADRCR